MSNFFSLKTYREFMRAAATTAFIKNSIPSLYVFGEQMSCKKKKNQYVVLFVFCFFLYKFNENKICIRSFKRHVSSVSVPPSISNPNIKQEVSNSCFYSPSCTRNTKSIKHFLTSLIRYIYI